MSPLPSLRQQRGIALAVGLIFLIIVTLVGLAAMRVTTSQTMQAATYQFKTVTFQGAESAIHAVMAEIRGEVVPSPAPTQNILVQALNATTPPTLPAGANQPPVRVVDTAPPGRAAGFMTSTAVMTSDNPDGGGVPLPGYSLSGRVTAYRFSIRATSTLRNTAATSDHQQGVARIGPKP